VGGERLEIHADGEALIADVAELRAAWTTALPRSLGL
jgi:hypothetical protein